MDPVCLLSPQRSLMFRCMYSVCASVGKQAQEETLIQRTEQSVWRGGGFVVELDGYTLAHRTVQVTLFGGGPPGRGGEGER